LSIHTHKTRLIYSCLCVCVCVCARARVRVCAANSAVQCSSCDDITLAGSAHLLQLPSSSSARRLSAPERQSSTPSTTAANHRPASPAAVNHDPTAYHAAGSMSVDMTKSDRVDSDDLLELLMSSDTRPTARTPVCCTPPRRRRRSLSKSKLMVDTRLMTQRERTPSPSSRTASPALYMSDHSASVSPDRY